MRIPMWVLAAALWMQSSSAHPRRTHPRQSLPSGRQRGGRCGGHSAVHCPQASRPPLPCKQQEQAQPWRAKKTLAPVSFQAPLPPPHLISSHTIGPKPHPAGSSCRPRHQPSRRSVPQPAASSIRPPQYLCLLPQPEPPECGQLRRPASTTRVSQRRSARCADVPPPAGPAAAQVPSRHCRLHHPCRPLEPTAPLPQPGALGG